MLEQESISSLFWKAGGEQLSWENGSEDETGWGWDEGLFAALLQGLHLDKYLLKQQNIKKLQGTKNNCLHVQLG